MAPAERWEGAPRVVHSVSVKFPLTEPARCHVPVLLALGRLRREERVQDLPGLCGETLSQKKEKKKHKCFGA